MRIKSLALLLSIACLGTAAQAAEPAAESDSAKMIRLTRALEHDPLGDTDNSMRAWLLDWLMQMPDHTVVVCDAVSLPVKDDRKPNVGIYVLQQMFGNGAYQIEHPDDKDASAPLLAGVESMLRAYSAVLTKEPRSRIAYLDTLLEQEKAGTLKQYMTPILDEKCAKNRPSNRTSDRRRGTQAHPPAVTP
ncbi:hypothetical protein [Lysobacter sp. Root983]|uniref:hypothetical protein n=1 Tax=Lysobacter sp. Root983 TaxID=1736613 RepID=UPI00070B0AB2|nr:hypothetical protein [Lysobacter sp. Root983]KRD73585.1 hypothetical protein ASE43_18440 [Lysobacter sp. Root983]